jgi:hypothetical protein
LAIKADLIKLLVAQQDGLLKLLRHLMREESAPEPEYEPPPRKSRPKPPTAGGSYGEMQARWESHRLKAEAEGWTPPAEETVSMDEIGRACDREVSQRRWPRSPEAARRSRWW